RARSVRSFGEGEALHEVADLGAPVPWRRRWPGGGTGHGRLVIPADRGGPVELMVDRGEGREPEVGLDELEDRGVLIEPAFEVSRLGPQRARPDGDTEGSGEGVPRS